MSIHTYKKRIKERRILKDRRTQDKRLRYFIDIVKQNKKDVEKLKCHCDWFKTVYVPLIISALFSLFILLYNHI